MAFSLLIFFGYFLLLAFFLYKAGDDIAGLVITFIGLIALFVLASMFAAAFAL